MHVGQAIGPFIIEKELGSGAMGTVYRARLQEDGKPDRVVALKVIAFGLSGNEQALARFEREYKILKQLSHPNIVRNVGTGRYKGTSFFAMEFVDGRSLDKVMAERTVGTPGRAPFTWEEVVEMGKPLCAALQHAHDKGIIHRDLKPSNLMVTREGVLKLTDFGIAKDIDVTALTGANNTIGTAAYMSPEQCKGEKHLTGKSDLYSLGVVFYELLTGRKPFMAESSVDMFLLHVQGTFERPAKLNSDIPVWLDTLVCQMMEKRPEHRPRDAAMVGQVLEEIEEKIASQMSAGADIATARGVDTKKIGDDDDRRAARAIRAGSRKKKLRRKRRPFYRHNLFVALAAMALIGGMAWFVYEFAIAPPSAESLLKQLDGAKSDPDAQQAIVTKYLKYYGDRDDDTTRKMKDLDRELKVNERARVLLNRHGSRWRATPNDDDDPDAYKKTMAALATEDDGDLAAARTMWGELVEKYAQDSNQAKALWGWHAQKKLNDLAAAENHIAALLKRLEDFRLDDKDAVFDDEVERRVVSAIRLEELKDFSLAYNRWSQLAENLKGEKDRRVVFVLARGRAHELAGKKGEPKDTAARAVLIAGEISRAKDQLKTNNTVKKRDARNKLRDIRDLYTGETGEIAKLISEAKTLLSENPA